MEYLGFLINSLELTLALPGGKMQKLIQSCKQLLQNRVSSVREIAKVVGKLTSSMQAILPAPLHYRHLQMLQIKSQGGREVIRDKSNPGSELQGRSSVVDRPYHQLERSLHNYSCSRPGYNYGCFFERLGSSLSGHSYKGSLDATRVLPSHQCPGVDGSLVCSESIHSKQSKPSCTPEDGQQDCNRLHSENGGHTVNSVIANSPGFVGQQNYTNCRISPRGIKQPSRLGIETLPRLKRLEVEPQCIQNIESTMGPTGGGSVCQSHELPTRKICELVSRSICNGSRCLSDVVDRSEGLQFPPFSLICHCLAKVRREQATIVMITPTWPTQAWYPILLEMSCRQPIMLPPLENLLMSPSQQVHPLVQQGNLTLAAWMVSGKISLQKGFQKTLLSYSAPIPGARAPKALTTVPGHSGVAGAFRGKLIHFAPLWPL